MKREATTEWPTVSSGRSRSPTRRTLPQKNRHHCMVHSQPQELRVLSSQLPLQQCHTGWHRGALSHCRWRETTTHVHAGQPKSKCPPASCAHRMLWYMWAVPYEMCGSEARAA